MKQAGKKLYWFLILVLGTVLLDEWLKYKSLLTLPDEGSLVDSSFLAFAVHKNYGVAFDIPFKLELVILVSIVLIFILLRIAHKTIRSQPRVAFSSLVIVIGALGNLFDRIYYGFTVDYIIFFNQSAINLSDLVIIFGVVLLLLSTKQASKKLTM